MTKEKYLYQIKEDEVKYLGQQGEVAPEQIEKSNITFTYHPTPEEKPWTNQGILVEIIAKTNEYELQYSFDSKNWRDYRRNNFSRRK